jgi:peptide/nickel transport system substrate-binding protein
MHTISGRAGRQSRREFLIAVGRLGGVAGFSLLAACAPAAPAAPTSAPAPAAAPTAAPAAPTAAPAAPKPTAAPPAAVAPTTAPTAATKPAAAGPNIKPGGTLKAALTGNPDKLDPGTLSVYTSAQVVGAIFNKLIEQESDGSFYGVLAKSWSSPNPTTWMFDLEDNVTFHNGEKFTAEDVKYTLDRIKDPKTASPAAVQFAALESVEVASPTRAVFHLSRPFGPILTNLAATWIVNRKAVESSDPVRNPVGTGPFKLTEWVNGDHITLDKNPNYFKSGRPYLDKIIFYFRLVDESRIQALRSGELNWVDAIPLQQVNTLKTDPAFNFVTAANAGIPDFIAFNNGAPPFDNKALRQAVAWAMDRKAIKDIAYFGTGEVGVEEVPSASIFYDNTDLFATAPDIAKAKAKLAEAGYPNGLQIEYLGLPQYPELLKTGQVLQQQLKAIGIDMSVSQLEVGVWVDRYLKGDYQLTSAYAAGTVDPNSFYVSDLKTNGGFNAFKYSNPKADDLIDQAQAETDTTRRKDLYKQIRAIIADDVPITFAHYETLNYLMQKNVVGSTINPNLQLRVEQIGYSA